MLGRALVLASVVTGLCTGCAVAEERVPRTLQVSMEAPSPCWKLTVEGVYQSDTHLITLSRLERPMPDLMCAQVVTPVSASVEVQAPSLPVRHIVVGHPWGANASGESGAEEYVYAGSAEAAREMLAGARRLP